MNILNDSAWIEIQSSALHHNVSLLRSKLHQTPIIGIIKANAYGHGMLNIARLLDEVGINFFGVATLSEAISLRQTYPHKRILILGALIPEQFSSAIEHQLEFMLFQQEDLTFLNTLNSTSTALLHLKVDTGMGRVGILPHQVFSTLDKIRHSPFIKLQGICSHLASSDQKNFPPVQDQLRIFQALKDNFQANYKERVIFHIGNSDAIYAYPQAHFDYVRAGISLYGYGSYPDFPLQPVLSLKGRITQIKTVPINYKLGYGGTYTTQRESRIGLIPLGYADGVNRLLSNQQDVLIQGQRIPIVGRVSMDQTILDLSDHPQISRGDIVTMIGQDGQEKISAEDWANKIGTISYEVLTSMSNRIPRYVI